MIASRAGSVYTTASAARARPAAGIELERWAILRNQDVLSVKIRNSADRRPQRHMETERHGKAGLSGDMALRIEKAFGVKTDAHEDGIRL